MDRGSVRQVATTVAAVLAVQQRDERGDRPDSCQLPAQQRGVAGTAL